MTQYLTTVGAPRSLMRWIIAAGNGVEEKEVPASYTLGTQRSDTAVAQQGRRSSCDSSPPEELAVDATLPAGITSSTHLFTLRLWWKKSRRPGHVIL